VTRLAAPLLLAAALYAPFQCGSRVPPEHRMEDDAAEVLYKLAEKFKTEGNAGAHAETLRFLVERYPTSRFAERAKIDLEETGPAKH
jgi:TolA-binding protein